MTGFSPFVLFASAGNVSGAAGDLWAIRRLRALPASVLVEDLETGYRAWEVTSPGKHGTINSTL